MKRIGTFLAAVMLLSFSCTKEEVKLRYSRQEENIESFINSVLAANDSAYVVHNKGVSRLVVRRGAGDSLRGGEVVFYYSGYVLSGSSVNISTMFTTNDKAHADSIGWKVSDPSSFAPAHIDTEDKDVIGGLRYGLEGVRAGEESYILFSGKYGFGKKPLGTIPANSALAYYVRIEEISDRK